MPERGSDEPFDPRTEWDRDGQYYHFLTKWMHALNRVWEVTGEETYHRWATELARAPQRGFLASGPGGKRLHWKMSVDLSRPLVPSSGHHDPLDGLLTLAALVETAPAGSAAEAGVLDRHLRDLWEMCRGRSWATDDPLGAGALLVDAYRCRRHGIGERLEDRSLCETIEDFWLDPANREVDGWDEHRDISRVMLATSLAPGGYLAL